jgi:hypothetical protein
VIQSWRCLSEGAATYTLTCSNSAGSAAASIIINVTARLPPHSSAGGALDELTVLLLAGAWFLRRVLARPN